LAKLVVHVSIQIPLSTDMLKSGIRWKHMDVVPHTVATALFCINYS